MAPPAGLETSQLAQNLTSAEALVRRLRETLSQSTFEIPESSSKSINPLALSSTAASLLKAHTTKLTLLVLNKPFTPSAIIQILSTISTSPLPALVSSAEICDEARYGKFARHELQALIDRVLATYEGVIKDIPTTEAEQARKLATVEPQSGSSNGKEAALMGAGLVWQMCDEIVSFAEQGIGVMAAKRMTAFRDLFEDAKDELRSWLETAQEERSLEDRLDQLQVADNDSDVDSMDSFSAGPGKEMIPVTKWALELLDIVFLLFSPLIKRRIKRFPTFSGKTAVETIHQDFTGLDRILDSGRHWSKQIDEVANGLYENEKEAAVTCLDQLATSVEAEVQAVNLNWDGAEDELSAWLTQWHRKFAAARANCPPMV